MEGYDIIQQRGERMRALKDEITVREEIWSKGCIESMKNFI